MRSIWCSMSGVNPAQENKNGVGQNKYWVEVAVNFVLTLKKKNWATYPIHFVTHKALPWHCQKLSCIPMSLYIKLHEGLSALFNITTQMPSTVPGIEPSGELNDSYDHYPDHFSSPSPYLAKS